jgi:hypothetical protein
VVAEGHGWFLRRYDQRRAIQFLAFLDVLPGLTIRGFGAAELIQAGHIVKKYSDQGLTLADAHGIAIMKGTGSVAAGPRTAIWAWAGFPWLFERSPSAGGWAVPLPAHFQPWFSPFSEYWP